MKTYNLNQLVSIQLNAAVVSIDYRWYPPKVCFGKQIKPAKIIWTRRNEFFCFAQDFNEYGLDERYQLIDGVVYDKPKVILNFADKSTETVYLNTLEDAAQWAIRIKNRTAYDKWLEL